VAEAEQTHQVADAHRLLDQGRHQPGRRHGDVHAPRLVEQPLVLRVVDPGDHTRDAVLRLRQQRDDQVDLVVARRGDHHVAALQRGLVQRGDLAGVGKQPLRHGDALDRDRGRRLVDEQDLVAVLQQFARDRAAHRTGSGNGDPHQ
jgi:hypothetical protein